METPSRHTFNLDGSTRVFPIPSPIKGDNYCRVDIDGQILNDRSTYDIVNNAIVFVSASTVPAGSTLDVLIVQNEEAIGQLGSTFNMDVVAQNIEVINTVGDDIDSVIIVADNINSVNEVAENMPDVIAASSAALDAQNAAEDAEKLAINPEDVQFTLSDGVTTGYSALHHANNASEDAAEAYDSRVAAANSASSAASSASSAASSASSAASSAYQAAQDASYADSRATAAAQSAADALASEQAAAQSETNAAQSAADAAADAATIVDIYDDFDDRYLGAKAGDPQLDNDGDPLTEGATYWNTTNGVMMVYSVSDGWTRFNNSLVATLNKYVFTATAGQTVFTGTDDDGNTLEINDLAEFATLNGVMLETGTDYTVTSTTLTMTTGVTANDELNVYSFGNFHVGIPDTVSAAGGGTFSGAVTFDDTATFNDTVTFATNPVGISTDLVDDTTPQLGGQLESNGHDINLDANDKLKLSSDAFQLYFDGTRTVIDGGIREIFFDVDGGIKIHGDIYSDTPNYHSVGTASLPFREGHFGTSLDVGSYINVGSSVQLIHDSQDPIMYLGNTGVGGTYTSLYTHTSLGGTGGAVLYTNGSGIQLKSNEGVLINANAVHGVELNYNVESGGPTYKQFETTLQGSKAYGRFEVVKQGNGSEGLVLPNLTETERDGLFFPPLGTMIYNTDTNKINFYNGSAWRVLDDSPA